MSQGNPTDRDTPSSMNLESLIPEPSSLPRKQQQLAEILRDRPEIFAFGNLRSIERLLSISGITVIRFAQRLGFTGFQALQTAVRDNYLSRAGFAPPEEAVSGPVDHERLIGSTIEQQRRNVESVLSTVHKADLQRVAGTLLGARRTLAFGTGSAGIVAHLLVRLMRHVGLRAELIEQGGVDEVISLHDVTSEDAVVVVSLWLNFAEAVRTLRLAKRLNASTVAIIGGRGSPLAALADQSLYAPGQGVALSFSLTAPVAMVECIIAAIAAQQPEKVASIQNRLHELYIEEDLIASLSDPIPRNNGKR